MALIESARRIIGNDSMNEPLISVYMPTHNRRRLLERAVASVLNQTYENIELVIVDDGSSDGTWDYLCSISDPRVKVYRHNHSMGACAARNYAISECGGEFVTGLDDDDYFAPNRVMDLWLGYDHGSSLTFARSFDWRHLLLSPMVYLLGKVTLRQLLNYNYVGGHCLVSVDRVKSVGGFDITFPALQDYELWVRLVDKYGPAKIIFSDSYTVELEESRERITNSANRLLAYEMFYNKHKLLMSKGNVNSLRIREAEWGNSRVEWRRVARSMFDGNVRWAIRYFIRLVSEK